jgi:feruloyl esterase
MRFVLHKEMGMFNSLMRSLSIAAMAALVLVAPAAAASCESLSLLALPDGKITSAVLVGAGAFAPPMGGLGGLGAFKAAPAFCRVTGTLTPTPDSDIKIEVWMPAEK